MKRLLLLALAAAVALAQPPATPAPLAPNEVLRVVNVTKASAQAINNNLSRLFPGITQVGDSLIIRGQAPVVDMIEEAIKKLDVAPALPPEARPTPNVELTVQLVRASAQEAADSKVPADLEATVRQLRSIFPYKSYRVMDTQIVLGRSGIRDLNVSGTVPGMASIYTFRVQPNVVPGPAPRMVHLIGLDLTLSEPTVIDGKTQYRQSTIRTEIDAREGQKTVVGKTSLGTSDDAIILVITPKVIE